MRQKQIISTAFLSESAVTSGSRFRKENLGFGLSKE